MSVCLIVCRHLPMDGQTAARLLLLINRMQMAILALEQFKRQRRIAALERHIRVRRPVGVRAPQDHFPAIDVYGPLARREQPGRDHAFLTDTRFTFDQFQHLLGEVRDLIESNRHVRMGVDPPSGQRRSCKATTENRLLLTLKFLAVGGTNDSLGVDFGLSPHVVSEDLQHVVHALIEGISYEIQFPTPAGMNERKGSVSGSFPDAVGLIDCTYTPSPRQHGDFSGHRWMPVRSHQVVTDPIGFILHVAAGLPGARHDSYLYRRSELPALLEGANVELLGDDAYIGMAHVRPPPRAADADDEKALEELRTEHTNKRSRIEQFF